ATVEKRASISDFAPGCRNAARVYFETSSVTSNSPNAPAPLACGFRSGTRSRLKVASFSTRYRSCRTVGPFGPTVRECSSLEIGEPVWVVVIFCCDNFLFLLVALLACSVLLRSALRLVTLRAQPLERHFRGVHSEAEVVHRGQARGLPDDARHIFDPAAAHAQKVMVVVTSAHFEQRRTAFRFDLSSDPCVGESTEHPVNSLERGARELLTDPLEHVCRLVMPTAFQNGEHCTAGGRRAKARTMQDPRSEILGGGGRNGGHASMLLVILNDSKLLSRAHGKEHARPGRPAPDAPLVPGPARARRPRGRRGRGRSRLGIPSGPRPAGEVVRRRTSRERAAPWRARRSRARRERTWPGASPRRPGPRPARRAWRRRAPSWGRPGRSAA